MAKVNPPPSHRLPQSFLNDRDTQSYIRYLENVVFQLWERTGGSEDLFDQVKINTSAQLQAQIIDLKQRLGTGDPFSWDETGFTWDSSLVTWDRTETG